MGKQGPHLGDKTEYVINYIIKEFGYNIFTLNQIRDKNIRDLVLKHVSYKYNTPNRLSNQFEIIPRQSNCGKKYKLKRIN